MTILLAKHKDLRLTQDGDSFVMTGGENGTHSIEVTMDSESNKQFGEERVNAHWQGYVKNSYPRDIVRKVSIPDVESIRKAADIQGANWLLATYVGVQNEHGVVVKVIGFHKSDLDKVLALPFPGTVNKLQNNRLVEVLPAAGSREPITAWTGTQSVDEWFGGKEPVEVGSVFITFINQGHRHCTVIAVDSETAEYLYEYEMPNGSSAIRRQNGQTIAYNALPLEWIRLIEQGYGIDSLIAKPQGCTIRLEGKVWGPTQNAKEEGEPLREWLKAKLAGKVAA